VYKAIRYPTVSTGCSGIFLFTKRKFWGVSLLDLKSSPAAGNACGSRVKADVQMKICRHSLLFLDASASQLRIINCQHRHVRPSVRSFVLLGTA
jgi:hypothetical protein